MADDRITEVETPSGNTHTTIVTDGGRSRGAGGTILIVLLLILLAGAAIWYFAGSSITGTSVWETTTTQTSGQ